MIISKELLEKKEDFLKWKDVNENYLKFASTDNEPVNYPCVIVHYLDENDYVLNASALTYEFVYLSDFSENNG